MRWFIFHVYYKLGWQWDHIFSCNFHSTMSKWFWMNVLSFWSNSYRSWNNLCKITIHVVVSILVQISVNYHFKLFSFLWFSSSVLVNAPIVIGDDDDDGLKRDEVSQLFHHYGTPHGTHTHTWCHLIRADDLLWVSVCSNTNAVVTISPHT